MIRPSLRHEKALFRAGHSVVAGCDEVGRGALSGPVTVGLVAVDIRVGRVPAGLADSKLLTPERRSAIAPRVRRWALAHALGHASPEEIDTFGILKALRVAALRALVHLSVQPDVVLLDGSHDWLSDRPEQADLFGPVPLWPLVVIPPVVTRVKADMHCAAVAGASVLAKTARDAHMVELARQFPHFGWAENKGYASQEHMDVLLARGPCDQHRRSWRLPTAATGTTLDSSVSEASA